MMMRTVIYKASQSGIRFLSVGSLNGLFKSSLRVQGPCERNVLRAPFSKFSDIVAEELMHEKAQNESDDIDQDFVDIKKLVLKNFTLSDVPGEGIAKLTRSHKDEIITVKFDCQNEADVDSNQPTEFNEDAEDGEEIEVNYGLNFEVTIKRKDVTLMLDCVASKSLEIRNVQYFPKDKATDDLDIYGGPRFEELDENLKEAFYDYLSDRKINDDLSFFVVSYSRFKEEKEYVNWLTKIGDFVQ